MINLPNQNSDQDVQNITAPSLSFIVPAMNEEETLETLYQGIKEQARAITAIWEIILIDDGSTDHTWEAMSALADRDPSHVRALQFHHNRGKADALALGYKEATGDVIFTMDADLQDDPTEIPRFLEKLNEGHDIVSGYKQKRYDPWHKVLPSRVFNAVLSNLVGVKLHDHNCGFKAYRKEVVKSLPMYGDMHRMVPSLASFEGYETSEIVVKHHPRLHGESKYGWGRIVIGLMDIATVSYLKRYRDCPMHLAARVSFLLGAAGVAQLAGSLALSLALGGGSALLICGLITLLTSLLVFNQGLMLEQQVYSRKRSERLIAELRSEAAPVERYSQLAA